MFSISAFKTFHNTSEMILRKYLTHRTRIVPTQVQFILEALTIAKSRFFRFSSCIPPTYKVIKSASVGFIRNLSTSFVVRHLVYRGSPAGRLINLSSSFVNIDRSPDMNLIQSVSLVFDFDAKAMAVKFRCGYKRKNYLSFAVASRFSVV